MSLAKNFFFFVGFSSKFWVEANFNINFIVLITYFEKFVTILSLVNEKINKEFRYVF